jgi:hypothetical protein
VRPDYVDPWTRSADYYGLIEEGMRQTDCLMVCVAHKGRHPFVDGGCHELPRPLPKRERVRIANQDREQPAAPVRVQFDADDLAEAIVKAELYLAERRQERAAAAHAPQGTRAPSVAPEPVNGQHEPASDQAIIGTPVGKADDGDI